MENTTKANNLKKSIANIEFQCLLTETSLQHTTTFSIEFPLIDNNIRIFLAIMILLHFIILFYTIEFNLFVMNLISAIFFPQIVRQLIYRLI